MIGIKMLYSDFGQANALVSDGVRDYRVIIGREGDYNYFVYDSDHNKLEAYKGLQETVYSPFNEIFLLLDRTFTACSAIYGGGILREISSDRDFVKIDTDKYRGSNIFTWRGEKYIACAEFDFTRDIPDYTYSVSELNSENSETYEALYQAVDSVFYPVLADLSNGLLKFIGEGAV